MGRITPAIWTLLAPLQRIPIIGPLVVTPIYVHFFPAQGVAKGTVAPTILYGPGLSLPGETTCSTPPVIRVSGWSAPPAAAESSW